MERNTVMIVAEKETFLVRTMEKKIKDARMDVVFSQWNVTEINSKWDTAMLLIMYLEDSERPPEDALHFISEKASERILTDLRDQQKRSKIPAGVPSGIETGNKTGELDNVDNDAAIIWSPNATYILVIMSSDTTGRIAEIQKLSSMVYKSINEESQ